jgi:hypothetical protein
MEFRKNILIVSILRAEVLPLAISPPNRLLTLLEKPRIFHQKAVGSQ